jgi:hypothetical protein
MGRVSKSDEVQRDLVNMATNGIDQLRRGLLCHVTPHKSMPGRQGSNEAATVSVSVKLY